MTLPASAPSQNLKTVGILPSTEVGVLELLLAQQKSDSIEDRGIRRWPAMASPETKHKEDSQSSKSFVLSLGTYVFVVSNINPPLSDSYNNFKVQGLPNWEPMLECVCFTYNWLLNQIPNA